MTEREAYEAALDTHKRFNPLEISESDFQIGWEAAMDYMKDRMLIICPDCKEAGCDKDEE